MYFPGIEYQTLQGHRGGKQYTKLCKGRGAGSNTPYTKLCKDTEAARQNKSSQGHRGERVEKRTYEAQKKTGKVEKKTWASLEKKDWNEVEKEPKRIGLTKSLTRLKKSCEVEKKTDEVENKGSPEHFRGKKKSFETQRSW